MTHMTDPASRKRPGPAPSGRQLTRPYAVSLYEWEIAGAKELGKGNISLGVRKALKRAGVKPPALRTISNGVTFGVTHQVTSEES